MWLCVYGYKCTHSPVAGVKWMLGTELGPLQEQRVLLPLLLSSPILEHLEGFKEFGLRTRPGGLHALYY